MVFLTGFAANSVSDAAKVLIKISKVEINNTNGATFYILGSSFNR
jgi:hypothetical protein